MQSVQQLSLMDYAQLVDFVSWLLDAIEIDPQFLETILFMDAAKFTRAGVVNTYIAQHEHVQILTFFRSNAQQRFNVSIWAGVIGNYLIGPYLLTERLNGNMYLAFLQNILPELLTGNTVPKHEV